MNESPDDPATMCRSRRAVPPAELFAVGCVVLLVAILLGPALVASRETARIRNRASQIRQIGTAVHTFHDSFEHFPASPGKATQASRPARAPQQPDPGPADLISPL